MTLYIDLDDTLCDYSGRHAEMLTKHPTVGFPQSQVDFYRKLEPLPEAIDAVGKLRESGRFDLWILSAPSVYNPMSYLEKRLWVADHFGMWGAEHLILCPDKSLLRGDVLVDDKRSGRGQEGFAGTLIELGSGQYPDWTSVLSYLLAQSPNNSATTISPSKSC